MGSSRIILIIDDELGARSALQAILERQYSVKLYARGGEAVDFVRLHRDAAHAAFVDFTMPELDGAAVCRLLSSADPSLSLIGISGNVAADFQVSLFATIEKRGTAIERVRETAAQAVAATCQNREVRDHNLARSLCESKTRAAI